jgi:hypothetical protein
LPSGVDPGTLACFIQTIGGGMAIDAQSGAIRMIFTEPLPLR